MINTIAERDIVLYRRSAMIAKRYDGVLTVRRYQQMECIRRQTDNACTKVVRPSPGSTTIVSIRNSIAPSASKKSP